MSEKHLKLTEKQKELAQELTQEYYGYLTRQSPQEVPPAAEVAATVKIKMMYEKVAEQFREVRTELYGLPEKDPKRPELYTQLETLTWVLAEFRTIV